MTLDDGGLGMEVTLGVGDALVLPADVDHCSLESEMDYGHVELYSKVSISLVPTDLNEWA
jgi:uncharacterized protein YjlB